MKPMLLVIGCFGFAALTEFASLSVVWGDEAHLAYLVACAVWGVGVVINGRS